MDHNGSGAIKDQKRSALERLRAWVPAVAALLLTAVIIMLAVIAGQSLASLFDVAADYGAPGAHPPGHFEALSAKRLGAFFAGFQGSVVVLTLTAASLIPSLRGSALALGWPKGGLRTLALSVIGLLAISGAIASLIYLLDPSTLAHDLLPFIQMARSDGWWILLLAASVGAPLAEELLFRGLLFGGLRTSSLGFMGAAILSAGIWSGIHYGYSIYALALVFGIGVYFAWLRERSGSLWPCIVAHAAYNGAIILALVFLPEHTLREALGIISTP